MSRQPTTGPPGATPPGGPGTRGLILLVVAVLAGILLLQQFDDGGDVFNTVTSDSATATTVDVAGTTEPTATVPRAPRPPSEVKVLPVNGTRTQGLGRRTGETLQAGGFNVLAAVDTQGGQVLEASAVQFAGDYEPEARVIAQLLGLNSSAVQAVSSPPVADTRDANVLVLIGPELNRPAAGGTTTTTTAGASRTSTTSARSTTSSSGTTRTTL